MTRRIALSPARLLAALLLSGASFGCSGDEKGGGELALDGGATGGVIGAGGAAQAGASNSGGASSAGGKAGAGAPGSGGRTASGGTASANGGSDPGSGGSGSGGEGPGSGGEGPGTGGAPELPGWHLAWSDEFEGPSGTPVDSSKWNLVNKGDGFGNNELQFYTNRTDNAALDGNGNLVITAKKESYGGREYTSARLESNGKYEVEYGRIEARLKLPKGQGIWPAFWMLGNDIGDVGWPTCGEIDVMENIGREPTIMHGTLHGPGYSGGNPIGADYTLPDGAKFADDFHVFAVEWEEDVIRFYTDGNLYATRTLAEVTGRGRWVYDHPFFMLMNVAVGGQWPGSPDGSTTFPQTMTADYVRVYAR